MNIILRRNGGERRLVPFYRPVSLLEEMDRFARDVLEPRRAVTLDHVLVSHTDMYEEQDKLVVKTEMPGINKEDLDITLEGDRLTIKAEKKEEVNEDATHHARERYYGQYFRSVTLPYPVKENKISATYDNGVLEITLPKAEEVKAKRIEVKAPLPEGEPNKRQKKAS